MSPTSLHQRMMMNNGRGLEPWPEGGMTVEHFEMDFDAQLKLALDLLEEFIPDYQLGERDGSKFLVVCGAGWKNIEAMVVEARKRLGDDNGLSQADHIAFEELISPMLSWSSDWGFEDNYTTCYGDNCKNIINTYEDRHWNTEYEIFCEECVRTKYHEDYFEALVNNPNNANTMLDEDYILKQGYVKLDDEWRASFVEGRTDNPEKLIKKLHEQGWDSVVFHIEDYGPFAIGWSAFVKNDNIRIEGHVGKWYIIGTQEHKGKRLFLLEHQTYGDEAASLIVDQDLNVVLDDVWNGFDDLDLLELADE